MSEQITEPNSARTLGLEDLIAPIKFPDIVDSSGRMLSVGEILVTNAELKGNDYKFLEASRRVFRGALSTGQQVRVVKIELPPIIVSSEYLKRDDETWDGWVKRCEPALWPEHVPRKGDALAVAWFTRDGELPGYFKGEVYVRSLEHADPTQCQDCHDLYIWRRDNSSMPEYGNKIINTVRGIAANILMARLPTDSTRKLAKFARTEHSAEELGRLNLEQLEKIVEEEFGADYLSLLRERNERFRHYPAAIQELLAYNVVLKLTDLLIGYGDYRPLKRVHPRGYDNRALDAEVTVTHICKAIDEFKNEFMTELDKMIAQKQQGLVEPEDFRYLLAQSYGATERQYFSEGVNALPGSFGGGERRRLR